MLALGALVSGSLIAAGGSTAAEFEGKPTIAGTPLVGQTLVADGANVYRWQRCASNCTGDGAVFADIPGAEAGQGANSYVPTLSDVGMWIRVLGKGAPLGTKFVASDPVGPVLGPPTPQQELTPVHGVHLIGVPTEGSVKFKPPGQKKFSPLSGITVIPVGSIINVRKGTINLVAATGDFGNRDPDNSMEFFDGVFKITQGEATDAPAIAKLVGKLGCGGKSKKGGAAAAASGPVAYTAGRGKRGLWGRGRGSYGTRGRGGTGSVVGTTWFTKDTCAGTLWKVTEGTGISVDPKGKKKDVFLGPGDSYFAAG